MWQAPEFWVGVAFFIFLGIIWKTGAFQDFLNMLDARAFRVKSDLAEAAKIRAEAEALYKSSEEKQRTAHTEASAIIDAATREAESLLREAHAKLDEFVKRRTAAAEARIAQAEAQAAADVKQNAADAAFQVSQTILKSVVQGNVAETIFLKSLSDVSAQLNQTA